MTAALLQLKSQQKHKENKQNKIIDVENQPPTATGNLTRLKRPIISFPLLNVTVTD